MTNEAAERLCFLFADDRPPTTQERGPLLDAALATERKATVERIRAALWFDGIEGHRPDMWISDVDEKAVAAILDAEAE